MDIEKLRRIMIQENYSEEYINKCIIYAKKLKDNGFPIIFDVKHLALLIGIQPKKIYSYYLNSDRLYNVIKVPKKSDGFRKLSVPSENLKFIQRWILDNILYEAEISENAVGFKRDKSIVDNAKKHVGKECVINLDIKDFFPSINFYQVFAMFLSFGYSKHLSLVLTGICTYSKQLPQGAPTSPYISNIICKRLDLRLQNLADKIGASYTRYADDITFSGNKEITKYIKLIKKVIADEKFRVNEKKVRVQYQYHQQMVTGIIVNNKISVPSKTKKYIRQQIYYSNKYGVTNHLDKIGIIKSNYRDHIFGLAYFIKMVESDSGEKILKEVKEIDWES